MKRQADGSLLWGLVVIKEAYSRDNPACHGYRRRSPSNETLLGEPKRFYVYVSYGIHHCEVASGFKGSPQLLKTTGPVLNYPPCMGEADRPFHHLRITIP